MAFRTTRKAGFRRPARKLDLPRDRDERARQNPYVCIGYYGAPMWHDNHTPASVIDRFGVRRISVCFIGRGASSDFTLEWLTKRLGFDRR